MLSPRRAARRTSGRWPRRRPPPPRGVHAAAERDTTVAGVALAWVRQRPIVTSTIIGARTVTQLDANLGSLDVTLSPEYLAELDGLTTPALNFPATFLRNLGFPAQQGTTVINGYRAGT
ncbi:aldo/keto reductase [Plantactinospora sp. CA-294935]|uniref:aldo/keto reductase n=1 Tax=Plantactinospora sp. CA-294935 TaxID=3240012 RepID=UPI003D910231